MSELNKGSNKQNKAQQFMTEAAIQNILNDMPRIIEMAKLQAKLKRVNFEAYIAEGFTEDQAIDLCKMTTK